MPKRAVLLVNLGSPDSTSVPDVRRYLSEFLGDPRVIDKPDNRLLRSFLVNQIIIRKRVENSAHAYSTIWTPEGSPLIVTSRSVRDKLAARLAAAAEGAGDKNHSAGGTTSVSSGSERTERKEKEERTAQGGETPVYLAMRYGEPSIASVVAQLAADGVEHALLFPQYPHYAMSSWETVVAEVYEQAARLAPELRVDCVQPFYNDADYIDALVASARPALAQPHDLLLFSYHGIPERHLRKADTSRAHCTLVRGCCEIDSPVHGTCYKAQCLRTTQAFVRRAALAAGRYSVSFQSRLVGEPWLSPFTDETLARLPSAGVKRLLVMSPAFVTDCLETLEEIAIAGRKTFLDAGGESYYQIPCLNDQPMYIDFLEARVRRWLAGEAPSATQARERAALLAEA
ncbi:ferrochelatase [Termitidicoccus mucosus]|uniref:Ferrochelatase n=1 Tax=Termitidicoccus mucosus TaxID=1184151 RepID=A0A178IJ19_9BACT|nr:ferrochelatase [Opitutaceae bacterium TSB47]